MKSCESETFADRVVRLLGANLKRPEKTREVLVRLTSEQKAHPQPRNHAPAEGPLRQAQLFSSL